MVISTSHHSFNQLSIYARLNGPNTPTSSGWRRRWDECGGMLRRIIPFSLQKASKPAVLTLKRLYRDPLQSQSQQSSIYLSSSWRPCFRVASYTVSNHCFIALDLPALPVGIRRLYCVCTSEWRLIKVDAQLTPRIALESCSRSWSKISAIPCRNSGLIGKFSFVCI